MSRFPLSAPTGSFRIVSPLDHQDPILVFRPDGTIEVGPGYSPTEAADAFVDALRPRLAALYQAEVERAAGIGHTP